MADRGRGEYDEDRFLALYPEFARRPAKAGSVRYVGYLERVFTAESLPDIVDAFRLEMVVSARYPKIAPRVFETGGRIPRDYHRLEGGAFCLSSRLRLAIDLHRNPDLTAFFESYVIPYLYRYAHLEKFGTEAWPDLPHFEAGLLKDYARLFAMPSDEATVAFLERLGERKRVANKLPCPCASGKRVGRCHHLALEKLRGVRPRGWFRAGARELGKYLDRCGPRTERGNAPLAPADSKAWVGLALPAAKLSHQA